MKKVNSAIALVTLLILTCFFTACGGSSVKNEGGGAESQNSAVVTGISVTPPTKTLYKEGESVDTSGMKVEVVYENGEKSETDDYSILYPVESDRFAEGDKYFTVKYKTFRQRVSIRMEVDKTIKIIGDMYDEVIKGYLKADDDKTQISYLTAYVGKEFDKQGLKIKWAIIDGAKEYIFHLSQTEDFSDETVLNSSVCEVTPGMIYPDEKYFVYAQAVGENGEIIDRSEVFEFTAETDLALRQVNVEGVYNMRDLGGWKAQGESTVNYGLLYRGGSLAGMTEQGKKDFAEKLGIKTEIDLRTDGTQQTPVNGVKYVRYGIWQYSMIIPGFVSKPADDNQRVVGYHSGSPTSLRGIFELLSDENNYPVYFHCNQGADRTGTLAFLINGLIGVDYSDLTRDFELTTFSRYGARYRSKIKNGAFTADGIQENTSNNLICFGELKDLIINGYGEEGKPLSYAIENYLVTVCGVSKEVVGKVRSILLSGEEIFDEPDIDVKKVNGEKITPLGSGASVSVVDFGGLTCYKATASSQENLCVDVSKINAGSKITFKMFVPSGSAKLGGLGEMSIRVKNPDKYLNFISEEIDGYQYIPLDEWKEYEVDISAYTEATRFAFLIPKGNTVYLADIIIV
ncbi:MAG: tyrosine-protein phosphatase [Clostridia bacterium]|nr:tyrosine-protein phosphatase [Clostridia bacterium]